MLKLHINAQKKGAFLNIDQCTCPLFSKDQGRGDGKECGQLQQTINMHHTSISSIIEITVSSSAFKAYKKDRIIP